MSKTGCSDISNRLSFTIHICTTRSKNVFHLSLLAIDYTGIYNKKSISEIIINMSIFLQGSTELKRIIFSFLNTLNNKYVWCILMYCIFFFLLLLLFLLICLYRTFNYIYLYNIIELHSFKIQISKPFTTLNYNSITTSIVVLLELFWKIRYFQKKKSLFLVIFSVICPLPSRY